MAKLQTGESDQHSEQSLCVRADDSGQVSVSVCRRAEMHGHIRLPAPESNAAKERNQR
jgi:hypothetical protein